MNSIKLKKDVELYSKGENGKKVVVLPKARTNIKNLLVSNLATTIDKYEKLSNGDLTVKVEIPNGQFVYAVLSVKITDINPQASAIKTVVEEETLDFE